MAHKKKKFQVLRCWKFAFEGRQIFHFWIFKTLDLGSDPQRNNGYDSETFLPEKTRDRFIRLNTSAASILVETLNLGMRRNICLGDRS
jgi:hypothetical protein